MAAVRRRSEATGKKKSRCDEDSTPPVFQIDLSLPPSSRYVALAAQYCSQLRKLMHLFSWLLADIGIPLWLLPLAQRLSQLFLRQVYSAEENLELQGISRVTQIPMYLLVSFNVVLDLLMGCTSGAARTPGNGQDMNQTKMLHFRTLDWSMDQLREIVVQLEFVKSASKSPIKVLATSITYVGFVGVLTGVRRGLSMSINFRPQHNVNKLMDNVKFYAHNLLVLLGRRESISSVLRSYLLSEDPCDSGKPPTLDYLARTVILKASTAAYLTFSDGQSTITIEKDRITGKVRESRSFMVTTNHDLDSTSGTGVTKQSGARSLLQDIIAESVDRQACMTEKWKNKVHQERTKHIAAAEKLADPSEPNAAINVNPATSQWRAPGRLRSKSFIKSPTELHNAPIDEGELEASVSLTASELREWLTAWPTTNECTHFSAIMDPSEGNVVWTQRYLTPVRAPSALQTRSSSAADRIGNAHKI